MPQVTIKRAVLTQLVRALRTLKLTRSALPALRYVRLHGTSEGVVYAQATNLEECLQLRLHDEPVANARGSMLVHFDELAALAKAGKKSDAITIEGSADDRLTITDTVEGRQITRTADTMPTDEWPAFDIPTDSLSKCSVLPLLQAYRVCADSSSTDASRHALNSVYADSDNGVLVGTDGRRLTRIKPDEFPFKTSAMIRCRRFLMQRTLKTEYDNAGMGVIDNSTHQDYNTPWFVLRAGPWTYSCQCVEGTYPNYEQVIPALQAYTNSIDFAAGEVDLVKSWDRQLPHNGDDGLLIYADGQKVVMLARDESGGFCSLPLPGASSTFQSPTVLAFNHKYVVTALGNGFLTARVRNDTSPVYFEQEGALHLIMPMRGGDIKPVLEHIKANVVPPAPAPAADNDNNKPKEPAMAQKKKPSTSRTTDQQQQSEPAAVQDPIAKLTEDIDAVYTDLRSAATAVKELKQQLRTLKQQQKQQQREYKSAMDLIDRMQKLAA